MFSSDRTAAMGLGMRGLLRGAIFNFQTLGRWGGYGRWVALVSTCVDHEVVNFL